MCKTETIGAVFGEIKFVQVNDLLKCFEVWIRGQIDCGHVVFPNEVFSDNVGGEVELTQAAVAAS